MAAALALSLGCAASIASFDDARIKEDVTGALNTDHISGIAISVQRGRVTLVGLVPTAAERTMAAADAERVPGVIAVDNQIEVSGQKE